ncbi:MAG: hypothetical protein J2P18_04920 [Nocardia sp.]|nr:hypothetical protein [Nocardia sp.]
MAAVLLGIVGIVLPFLPLNLTGIRPLIGLPFAVAGLACALAGCIGNRRAKGLAIAGALLSTLALAVSLMMLPQLI